MTQHVAKGYHHGNLRVTLIEGALALLAESGLAAFSVARLAKRVGVSPAAPYRHFGDRDELVAELAVRVTTALVATMEQAVAAAGTDPERRLAATAGAYARYVLVHGVGLELTFAPQFRSRRFAAVHEQSRALIDLLLPLAHAASAAPAWEASLELLEAHLAIAEGFAAFQRHGALAGMNLSTDQVAERATRASRRLIRGARTEYLHDNRHPG